MHEVSELLKDRAFMFACSYKTAWNEHMKDDEKEGYTFNQVIDYISANMRLKGLF